MVSGLILISFDKTFIIMKLNSISHNANALSIVLLLARIFIGFAMLTHGYPKLHKLFSGEEVQFISLFGLNSTISLGLAVFAEFVCSFFIILGLFTRIFTIPLMITMTIAAFYVHSADGFSERELALLYLCIYIMLFIIGAGKYSIDGMLQKNKLDY